MTIKTMLFVLLLVATTGAGCTLTGGRKVPTVQSDTLGMVRTEGALIKNKTLLIPASGLTLGDVIEQCERTRPNSTTVVASPARNQKVLAVYNNKFKVATEALSDAIRELPDTTMRVNALQATRPQCDALLAIFMDNGIELEGGNANAVNELQASLVALKLSGLATESKLAEITNAFNSRIPDTIDVSNDGNVSDGRSSDVVNPVEMVVLSRRTGRRIVVPLVVVKSWIAGDIALADGDQIGIMVKEGLSAFVREAGEGESDATIVLSGLTSREQVTRLKDNSTFWAFLDPVDQATVERPDMELEQYANVIVLQSLSDTGQMEEYILPNPRYPAFTGFRNELNQIVGSVYVQDGDHYHFGALELTPLLLSSRAQNRRTQKQAIDAGQRQDPSVARTLEGCQTRVADSFKSVWNSIPRPSLRN